MEIGLLVSGGLGCEVFKELTTKYKINFILTDKQSIDIIEMANAKKIRTFAGNPRKGRALAAINDLSCDVLVSVNYLFLIEKDLISFPKRLAINFHGSLLPKYRGRTPHVWAIINNETETGITSHLIEESCDTGDILAQKLVKIEPENTGADILQKYRKEYPGFVISVLNSIEKNNYSLTKQNNKNATFFGKRTADDGLINWNWQKERINNWIRAQAKPYPGAFTFANHHKIIIHKIQFSEVGFSDDTPNGKIMSIENKIPIVKTPNGCVALIDFECPNEITLNEILK